jgi:hypothetical protein
MKVRCIRIISDSTGERLESSTWLTVGKIYHVLEIFHNFEKRMELRVPSDDDMSPTLNQIDQFELVSGHLPSNWIAVVEPGRFFKLTPRSWSAPGFWEKCFDGDSDAEETFWAEQKRIVAEDP